MRLPNCCPQINEGNWLILFCNVPPLKNLCREEYLSSNTVERLSSSRSTIEKTSPMTNQKVPYLEKYFWEFRSAFFNSTFDITTVLESVPLDLESA